MDARRENRPRTAIVLEQWRRKKKFSKQGLADASDVSGTYVRMIEEGFDPQTGKPVIPSAKVILQLSRALGEGNSAEERQVYEDLMAAAGYLDTGSLRLEDRGVAFLYRAPALTAELAAPTQAPPLAEGDVKVTLRDRRLHRDCRELLESWEALTSEDQAALLAFMEFIAERRRRREAL